MKPENRFDSVAKFLLEVRREFHPGKPAEICLGRAFLSLREGKDAAAELERLRGKLNLLSVRADTAHEMIDFLRAKGGIE